MRCLVGLCAALLASALAAEDVTPIAKVTELLKDMHEKGVKAKKEEETKYSAFKTWCADQDRIKGAEIAAATEQIDSLSAGILKNAAVIRSLSDRIQELDEDVGRWNQDKASATDVRQMEKSDYEATLQDYQESIDAIAEAIKVLQKQAFDRSQAESSQATQALIQLTQSRVVPPPAKSALAVFLQHGSQDYPEKELFYNAPEAHGYEFQSGGVVDMLKKLQEEFGHKKYDLEREGLNAKHSYEQLMQRLTDSIENAEHEITKKTTTRAETQQAKAEAEGDLAQVTADQAEDEKYLKATLALCTNKASDFWSRSKLRDEELEAIQKAIAILSSDDVSGAADRHLPSSFLQRPASSRSLAQLRSEGVQQNILQTRVADFLAERAKTSHSSVLSLLSQKLASGPFDKVKKMIQDLIYKLMEEATAETEHKGWCDAELATNKLTREHRTEEVNKLAADKEDLESTIEQLGQDIADLSSAMSELRQAMAEADRARAESKERNEQTIQEAKDAQTAVMKAIAVLKSFYAMSGQAEALIQQTPEEDAPETFDKSYQGMLPESGNVVGFLEVILSDFARLESETDSTEATEVDDHNRYTAESEKDLALKQTEVSHKQDTKFEKEEQLHRTTEELQATQTQLTKAIAYYEKLKPTCVDSGVTYEERVRRREEEIQSLQEALKILGDTDLS